ncbi:MAG: S1/P1 nuclease [Deltaproteobacteria bacterium]|nr:S1/P1 nuclease [Deltaproteobacteria bacterium]
MVRIKNMGLVLMLGCLTAVMVSGHENAWGWGKEGHEIVAIIAADNLSQNARKHVARILKVPANNKSVATAMAAAAILPDTKFKTSNPETKPWHFIDICLQDKQTDLPARCPDKTCVVAKIDEDITRLRDGHPDHFGAKGDLAFLIHFVGDIHQPLHAATNADRGGNCVKVVSHPPSTELHDTWDRVLVQQVAHGLDTGNVKATAGKLEDKFGAEKAAFAWKPDGTADIAWESTEIARKDIYIALQIPEEECKPDLTSCTLAPPAVGHLSITLSPAELNRESDIAARQLAKAGYRLASLLNTIWP